ncbi:MAG: group II intron reverse transcriptase/maturase [Phycisphaerales bacterium]|nr:group II intron reverse transcriptase/maturase [Phycisphaerales bacterium]
MPVEGRGLGSRQTSEAATVRRLAVGLTTPETIERLQAALHAKAKRAPDFRFYSLYDKIHREDVLSFAYRIAKSNRGVPGVDGQTFGDIESYGAKRWLGELAEELRNKRYRPQAVRRALIPKPGQPGRTRPLGIPTIRDRVAQTAVMLVLEPIFEADLPPEQHAYRVNHSALDAVRQTCYWVDRGHDEVVDADLSGYFDTIPHTELMKSVSRRISDGAMLHLIRMWLRMPVEETDRHGRVRRTTKNRDTGRGTPQGSPISPLLSNVYMRRFVVGWKTLGHERRLQAKVINYADDFVICCRGTGSEASQVMRRMMSQLRLTVNEAKTSVCSACSESFDFLGYTISQYRGRMTGKAYIGTLPSRKSTSAICREITDCTSRRTLWKDLPELVSEINRTLVGWANYFSLGAVDRSYRRIDQHVRYRLRRWLRKKHKVRTSVYRRWPDVFFEGVGLVNLVERRRSLSCANA